MATTTIFSGTGDGQIHSEDADYADTAAGTGTTLTADTANTNHIIGQYRPDFSSYAVREFFAAFDTSTIGGDTISAATLSLHGGGDSSDTDFDLEARPYSFGTLATGDWRTPTHQASDTLLASFDTVNYVADYLDFTENGSELQDAIDPNGTTELYVASSRHRQEIAPTGDEYVFIWSADRSGTSEDPKLVITHTAPAPTVAIWDGSAWVDKPVKYWDGSTWATPSAVSYWDGSAWVSV